MSTSGAEFSTSPVLRQYWYPVAAEESLANGPVARRLLGERIVIFKGQNEAPVAFADSCPHRNAPLSAGHTTEGQVTCPYHGWVFDDTGNCVAIPSAGSDARVPPSARLQPYYACARYGLVWVALSPPTNDIPLCPYDDDPHFRRLNTPVVQWTASATRMVDNFLDTAHIPWVHRTTFGSSAQQHTPAFKLQDLPDGFFGYSYEVQASNDHLGQAASGQHQTVIHRRMTTGFTLPFTVRSTIHYDSGLEHNIYLFTTPIDDVTSYFTFVVWRNDDFSTAPERVLELDRAIAAEDQQMLEHIPGPLPLQNSATVSVQSDRASIAWRRRFQTLLIAPLDTPRPSSWDYYTQPSGETVAKQLQSPACETRSQP
ncbi:Rieske 2Fe-2S domain-containing protein [Streptomyces sp. 1222.5]|uniref:Rieske 2Fe-2S domain-containing protein n=1 Tax=Streptomyces sp. 1222.5 TaxID=1881026 RepID=UPI003EBE92C9